MSAANFDNAAKAIEDWFKNGGDTSNDNKLALYKFFKQGSVGDCNTERPGGLNPFSKDKAKWDAWNGVKGCEYSRTSQEEAKVQYVKLAKSLLPKDQADKL